MLLILCADFLTTHRYLDISIDMQLQEVLEALRDLKTVNNLAQDYMPPAELEGV
jgi:hypothetical protein